MNVKDLQAVVTGLTPVFQKAIGDAIGPALKRIEALEARHLATPEKGDPGQPGENGKDADPIDVKDVVAELISCSEMAPIFAMVAAEAVAKHFEANPVVNGRDGKDGEPGTNGQQGVPGEPGRDGKDGVGAAGAVIDQKGALILTLTDGRTVELGPVVGKDGAPGKDGVDGFGFDDFTPAYDGERGLTFTFTKGDRTKTFEFHVPTVIDRGYWREGTHAKAGDGWTHDGSWWIAQKDTDDKPTRESANWRMGARKGRDGERGAAGKDFKPEAPVRLEAPRG